MKNARPLLLAASAVALLISACSQAPADLEEPTLAPQFGSTDDDFGRDVTLTSAGDVYVLAEQTGRTYDSGNGGEYANALLKRYDSRGTLLFSKNVASYTCDNNVYEDCGFTGFSVESLHADANGSTYALIDNSSTMDDSVFVHRYSVHKADASGRVVKTIEVGTTGNEFDSPHSNFLDVAVDKAGAIYVAKRQYDYQPYPYETDPYTDVIAKYSTNGALQWQRTSTVGVPKGITVAASGNVYVVGSTGIGRYTNTGSLTWTQSGGGDDVTLSGSSLYVREGTTIRRHDSTGKQLWAKTQSGLPSLAIADITGDGSGNVYLAGKYSATSTNRDAFTRKLNSSGSVVWTKPFGTAAYDEALGIATLTGSEIYTTGSTNGALSHANMGGSDGYLRKTNSSGDRVWTR